MKYIIAIILAFCLAHSLVFGAELPKDQVIRAMIGEASNQGYDGLYAMACAIKNRGTLKGVYGAKAKHVDSEPSWVWKLAKRAYLASLSGIDVTNGATHWENIKAFGKPYWVDSMVEVYRYKNHIFYKESK